MYWENINWWIQKGRRPLKFFFFDQNFEEKKTRLVQLQKKKCKSVFAVIHWSNNMSIK